MLLLHPSLTIFNIGKVAGKLKLFCFDKTGTLTEDGLHLWGLQSVALQRTGEAAWPFAPQHQQHQQHQQEETAETTVESEETATAAFDDLNQTASLSGSPMALSLLGACASCHSLAVLKRLGDDDSQAPPRRKGAPSPSSSSSASAVATARDESGAPVRASPPSAASSSSSSLSSLTSTAPEHNTVRAPTPPPSRPPCATPPALRPQELVGDPLEVQLFAATGWRLSEPGDAEHVYVPAVAAPYTYVHPPAVHSDAFMLGSGSNSSGGGAGGAGGGSEATGMVILKHYTFSSRNQRMSVLVGTCVADSTTSSANASVKSSERVKQGPVFCYVKGAPERVAGLCDPATLPPDFHQQLRTYTQHGLRVLAVAGRRVETSWSEGKRLTRDVIESNLQLLGLAIFENRVKPRTRPTIEKLTRAHIRSVMITGDNILTACSVARSSAMVPANAALVQAHVVDTRTATITDATSGGSERGDGAMSAQQERSRASRKGKGKRGSQHPSSSAGTAAPPPNTTPPATAASSKKKNAKPAMTTWRRVCAQSPNQRLHALHLSAEENGIGAGADGGVREDEDVGEDEHGEGGVTMRLLSNSNGNSNSNSNSSEALAKSHGHHHHRLLFELVDDDQGTVVSGMEPDGLGFVRFSKLVGQPPEKSWRPQRQRSGRRGGGGGGGGGSGRQTIAIAISGPELAMLRRHCFDEYRRLIVAGTVFARMSPDQKTQLIEDLIAIGYCVGMCGDGANDCGALKAAHVGVSLSEAEASVAAPFTSTVADIDCVQTLIREGRCALVTSFSCFKFMALYSFVEFNSVLILYWINSNLGDFQYLYVDLFVILTLAVAMGRTGPCAQLSKRRPAGSLVTAPIIVSLLLQIGIHIAFQAGASLFVEQQPWFVPLHPDAHHDNIECFENTTVFLISIFQYVWVSLAFSIGKPFRADLGANRIYLATVCVLLATDVFLVLHPSGWLADLVQVQFLPTRSFRLWLLALAVGNFIISYAVERALVGSAAFTRAMRYLRRKRAYKNAYKGIAQHIILSDWAASRVAVRQQSPAA